MAAGLRGRQLHGGYTLSVLLACNQGARTVGAWGKAVAGLGKRRDLGSLGKEQADGIR